MQANPKLGMMFWVRSDINSLVQFFTRGGNEEPTNSSFAPTGYIQSLFALIADLNSSCRLVSSHVYCIHLHYTSFHAAWYSAVPILLEPLSCILLHSPGRGHVCISYQPFASDAVSVEDRHYSAFVSWLISVRALVYRNWWLFSLQGRLSHDCVSLTPFRGVDGDLKLGFSRSITRDILHCLHGDQVFTLGSSP